MANTTREKAREYAESEARRRAVEAGADEQTLEVIDVMEVPLAYLPGNAVRYFLKVLGDLAESKAQSLEELSDQGTKDNVTDMLSLVLIPKMHNGKYSFISCPFQPTTCLIGVESCWRNVVHIDPFLCRFLF